MVAHGGVVGCHVADYMMVVLTLVLPRELMLWESVKEVATSSHRIFVSEHFSQHKLASGFHFTLILPTFCHG